MKPVDARSIARPVASLALALGLITVSCVARNGSGTITGELDAKDCWSGAFDLEPNFFGAESYKKTMTLRIQRDSDFFAFADGLSVLIDDFEAVRGKPADGNEPAMSSRYGQSLKVGLPPEVTPPNVPIAIDTDPPLVHMNLYLQKTCRTQNVALYAANEVAVGADGSCSNVQQTCDAGGATPEEGAPAPNLAHSTITFSSLFNGDILESEDAKLRIAGSFDVYLVDPRDACPGGQQPPPCRGHLVGEFDYLYERSRPYQPFP